MLKELIEKKGEFELKYTFHNLLYPTIDAYLSQLCTQDTEYPASKVQSIYLETKDRMSLQEKVNSDFFKTKFRIRWYEILDGNPTNHNDTPLFLEKKEKVGAKRIKKRKQISTRLHDLNKYPLGSAYHQKWNRLFNVEMQEIVSHLDPFIQISYTRKRYTDPATGTRLSLDYNIHVERTNGLLLPPEIDLKLETGVFEVKSKTGVLPEALNHLASHFIRKDNFSKYEQCVLFLDV